MRNTIKYSAERE